MSTTPAYDNWGNPTVITFETRDHANGLEFKQVTANRFGQKNPAPPPPASNATGASPKPR